MSFLENFFNDTQNCNYYHMFIIFLLLIEIIFQLNTIFPIFGIHLLTFSKAKVDIIMFIIFGWIILIAFTTFAYLVLGSNKNQSNDYGKNYLFLFQNVIK